MLLPCELANPLIRYKGAKIASGGMIPTLRIGELVIVNRGYYTDEPPLRGDLVLFTPENSERDRILRIIGLPGDTVELRDTQLFLNGEAYSEDYAQYNGGGNEQKNFGPEKIPPGHLFLLGDNRNHSEDSRLWAEPFLSIDRLKGKVVYIYWSPDNIERVGTSLILPDRKES